MKIATFFRSTLLAAAVAGAGFAQSEAIDFTALDTNQDGRVSFTEVRFVDELRATFPALDANRA